MTDSRKADAVHNAAENRFEISVDGHRGVAEYVMDGSIMTLTHTAVPSQIGGAGVANQLAAAALEHARANGLRVDPRCQFMAAFIRRHPEYQPLAVSG